MALEFNIFHKATNQGEGEYECEPKHTPLITKNHDRITFDDHSTHSFINNITSVDLRGRGKEKKRKKERKRREEKKLKRGLEGHQNDLGIYIAEANTQNTLTQLNPHMREVVITFWFFLFVVYIFFI